MNKTLDAMMQGFVDALHQHALQYEHLGRYEIAGEFAVGASVMQTWLDEGVFEYLCDNENERRGVARDAAALEDGWSGAMQMEHLHAQARKLK